MSVFFTPLRKLHLHMILTPVRMENFREVLKETGEFGFFQKALVAALCFTVSFSLFDLIGQVFTSLSFPYHCNTDWILERGPNLTQEKQRNLTLPLSNDGHFASCKMFTPVDWDLDTIEDCGINSTTECINGWDYNTPTCASSILTEVRLQYQVNSNAIAIYIGHQKTLGLTLLF